MGRRMMFIGDDGVARPFDSEQSMISAVKDGDAEKKILKKEVRTLRKLVSRYRSHLVYDKCHCSSEAVELCMRCTWIECIDTDLATIAKERDGG